MSRSHCVRVLILHLYYVVYDLNVESLEHTYVGRMCDNWSYKKVPTIMILVWILVKNLSKSGLSCFLGDIQRF